MRTTEKRIQRGMEKAGHRSILVWIGIVAFFAIFSYCLPKVSDDWFWTYTEKIGRFPDFVRLQLSTFWQSYDGRILGDALAILSANCKPLRMLLWVVLMVLLLLFSGRLTQSGERRWWWICLPLMLIFLAPKAWFSGDITWSSGFCIYIPPFVITLVCICLLRNVFYDKPVKDTWPVGILCLTLGFCGQLFSEIITFYACIVSSCLTIWHWIRFKKLSRTALLYSIGTILGAFLMSRSPAYSIYAAQEVEQYVYLRSVGLSLDKMLRIFRIVYDQVSAYSLEANLVPVAIISACGLCLLRRSKQSHRALTVAATVILSVVPIYFFVNACDLVDPEELVSLLPMGRILGGDLPAILLDMLLYAAYVLSVGYVLITGMKGTYGKSLGCFLLLSFLICTAPMCFTYPLSHRVFFSAYMFLVLLGLLMLDNLLADDSGQSGVPVTAVLSMTAAVCLLYLAVFSMNPGIERKKLSYITQCMSRQETIIHLPQFVFEQRLYLPQTKPTTVYYYEKVGDIDFEFVPYAEWLEKYYKRTCINTPD